MLVRETRRDVIRFVAAGLLLLAAGCGSEDDGEPSRSADASGALAGDAAPAAHDASSQGDAGSFAPVDSGAPPSGLDAGTPDAGGGLRDAGPTRDASAPPEAAVPSDAGPLGDGGPDPFAELRQVCVDTINMYRATLSLPPYARANAKLESCTDEGSKYDGDLNRGMTTITPHTSTANRSGTCAPLLMYGAQNTCPNWRVGPRTGNATLADALKGCLKMMWDEGMPPVPVKDCIADKTCFPKYGHWINMSSTSSKIVSCGFYDVGGGVYWLNQEFVAR